MVGKKLKVQKQIKELREPKKVDTTVQEIVGTPMVERKKFNLWEFLGFN